MSYDGVLLIQDVAINKLSRLSKFLSLNVLIVLLYLRINRLCSSIIDLEINPPKPYPLVSQCWHQIQYLVRCRSEVLDKARTPIYQAAQFWIAREETEDFFLRNPHSVPSTLADTGESGITRTKSGTGRYSMLIKTNLLALRRTEEIYSVSWC